MITKLQKFTAALCVLALVASPLAAIKPSRPADDVLPSPSAGKKSQQDLIQAAGAPAKAKPDTSQSAALAPAQKQAGAAANPDVSAGAVKEPDRILAKDGQVYPIRQYKTLLNPNDPSASQWWTAPNGMGAVWDIPYGTRQTKIAVIDTGFALAHQEFAGRWATNTAEIGAASSQGASKLNCTSQGLALNKSCNNIDDNFDGVVDNETGAASRQNPSRLNCSDQGVALTKQCNRLDDDGNGYIDDWRGWDFANFDGVAQAGETNVNGSGTTHGTMVAGVLGATGNNGVGVAGVNWYSSILPIQALDDDGYGDTYTVGEAIYYAADQGADVISISLGTPSEDSYLRLAIQYAMGKGAIVVAASGNDGCNCISYPANYPEVVAVGAIDNTNNRASFSSYGKNLDLLAPGAQITTSYWTGANQTGSYAANVAGTSFATPFVSGLLGLARSYQPDAAWEEILGAMLESSDRRTLTASAPRSNTLGYGVARASTMLDRLLAPSQPSIRYQFGGAPLLGSPLSYQCYGTLPASMLFELTKPGQLRYTASPYENAKAIQQGWTSREAFYSCIALPTDLPASLRVINLPAETKNIYIKP